MWLCLQDGGGEKSEGGEKEEKHEDEDNAVDMSEDFDGQVEDVPQKEGGQEDSDGEDSEGTYHLHPDLQPVAMPILGCVELKPVCMYVCR